MHIVTITTTTPTGELLHQDTLTTTGSHAEALDLAAHHAAAATIDIHADDPYKHHAHLIALGDEPHAVIAPRITPTGRTDLLATLRATTTLTH
ncbi:hypothetical protein M3G04_02905 [Dietzia cinnamea]|uniref:hypothetical protein n=1 Tax=Dietzia cinnamea TaxID=321318 RepID=UPI00223B9758|nr:hypothetical protein [Dietzia cinnamea]MCT2299856.1 hypothetical protein [Dietzia cinnamea]